MRSGLFILKAEFEWDLNQLMKCTGICFVLKEFDNTESAHDSDLNTAAVPADFSMYPPVENTPDSVVQSDPVTFEPLPDISQLRPMPKVR